MKNSLKIYVSILVALLAASVVLFALLYKTLGQTERTVLKVEALKAVIQLVAIGVVGGVLTWLLNERSKEKERDLASRQKKKDEQDALDQKCKERHEALNTFRRESVARVVTATNVVRKAPLLIEAHRSKKTYGEQMRAILDAKLGLSLLRHELKSTNAFSKSDEIASEFRKMESYLESLVNEWKEEYSSLNERPEIGWPQIELFVVLDDLRRGDKTSEFRSVYLIGYREALSLMREDIFGPIIPAADHLAFPEFE